VPDVQYAILGERGDERHQEELNRLSVERAS
jgi:hypothetical protein